MSTSSRNALRWALLICATLTTLKIAEASLTAHRRASVEPLLEAYRAEIIDAPAPDITWTEPDGALGSLADLEGQVVFVNFFATWCAPCLEELPDLERLAAEMEGQPFTLLAVSQDQDQATLDAFFKGRQSRMKVVLQRDGAAKRYGTEKLPESYIIDKRGRLRLRFVNVQPWTEAPIGRYLRWLASEG